MLKKYRVIYEYEFSGNQIEKEFSHVSFPDVVLSATLYKCELKEKLGLDFRIVLVEEKLPIRTKIFRTIIY